MTRAGALCFCFLLASSCVTTRPRTQVVVEIDAEPMIAADADAIDIVVRGGPALEELEQAVAETRRAPIIYPIRITIVPRDEDASRVFEVAALARTEGGSIIGRLRARGRFVPGQTAYIRLTLEDCCRGLAATCQREETCSECACVPSVIVDPEIDAGVELDAGLEASVDANVEAGDVGIDGGPPIGCMDAAECPAVPCSVASCTAGTCAYRLLCSAGETCCEGVCAADCSCLGQAGGAPCRGLAGVCDVVERCNGIDPSCPRDAVAPLGEPCRPSVDECDVADACDGTSIDCPPDAFVANGLGCTDGTCNGLGMCLSGCAPGLACATTNPCVMGMTACGPPRCEPAGPAPASTVCRPAVSQCDVDETCGGGTTCPTDLFASTSVVCRPSMGPCDAPDTCTGTNAACSSDVLRGTSTTCRASVGICDVAEHCSGSAAACPPDRFAPAGGTCLFDLDECAGDAACNGTSATCPAASDTTGRPCGPCNGTCQERRCEANCLGDDICCEFSFPQGCQPPGSGSCF